MNPIISNLKTTEDILLNYTNVEVSDGVYVNNSILKLFKNIEKDLSFVRVDTFNNMYCAVYEYSIADDVTVSLYTNAKHDYVEMVHFYKVPDFLDSSYIEIINVSNRNLKVSKAFSSSDDMVTVEISAYYSGEFSTKSFLRFMNSLHQDIVTFHKVTSIYLSKLEEQIGIAREEDDLKNSITKIISPGQKASRKISDIKAKPKKKVSKAKSKPAMKGDIKIKKTK